MLYCYGFTGKQVSKVTKDATEKVTETAESIKDKAKGSVSGALGVAQKATEVVKDLTGDK